MTRTETGTVIGIENVIGTVTGKERDLEFIQVNTLKIVLYTTLSLLKQTPIFTVLLCFRSKSRDRHRDRDRERHRDHDRHRGRDRDRERRERRPSKSREKRRRSRSKSKERKKSRSPERERRPRSNSKSPMRYTRYFENGNSRVCGFQNILTICNVYKTSVMPYDNEVIDICQHLYLCKIFLVLR